MESFWRNPKAKFPSLATSNVAYLDNAATTQIVDSALNAMIEFEQGGRANVKRGLYPWAERSTLAYEEARGTVANFIGALAESIAFTKGTTEGLNITARSIGSKLGPGDEVVVTLLDHHANILPWKELSKKQGFTLHILPSKLSFDSFSSRTRVVALPHVSNVLGAVLPVREIADLAHAVGAIVIVDAAQSAGHLPINVTDLGADFLAFSSHKMYGPMGIGTLYVAPNLLETLSPMLFGGGIVDNFDDQGVTYLSNARKFEAGTPNVTGAIGFAQAIKFIDEIGQVEIGTHEQELRAMLMSELGKMDRIQVLSPAQGRGIVAFTVDGAHPHDVAEILGRTGVMVRAGHHCATPLHNVIAPQGTVRVSLGVYNTAEDVAVLVAALRKALLVL